MANVYYDPEKFGLTQIGHIELAGSYEFDTYVLWKDKNGLVYWAYDTGCSCPIPFEDYTTLESLNVIRIYTDLDVLKSALGSRVIDGHSLDKFMDFYNTARNSWAEWTRGQRETR